MVLAPSFIPAAPVVTNVSASQQPGQTGLVDVYCDLCGGQAPMTVSVLFSSDNGVTWTVVPSTAYLLGNVGAGISNGANKHIVWNAAADRPGVNWSQARAKVTATESVAGAIEMVSVPAGTFTMGRRDDGDDGTYGYMYPDELPRHQVTLSAYQIGKYEVTNGQYCDVLNWALGRGYLKNYGGGAYSGDDVYVTGGLVLLYVSNSHCQIQYSGGAFTWKSQTGSGGVNYSMENHPVVYVTWFGAAAFCNWLSEKEGRTPCYNLSTWALMVPYPNGYRLPTEAEWERAAAWDGSKHWIYGFISDTLTGKNRCNYYDYYGSGTWVNPLELSDYLYTSPVGWFNGVNVSPNGSVQTVNSPSPVGAYDMSGNVWEWCHEMTDPTGPISGDRVLRGGSWFIEPQYCRNAYRFRLNPATSATYVGFRVVRPNGPAGTEYWQLYR